MSDAGRSGSKTRDSSLVKDHGFPDVTVHDNKRDPGPVEEQKDPKELSRADRCRGGCSILNDLRKYGFPDFLYTFTDTSANTN